MNSTSEAIEATNKGKSGLDSVVLCCVNMSYSIARESACDLKVLTVTSHSELGESHFIEDHHLAHSP